MSVAQRRIEHNAWKRKGSRERQGASPPVSTHAFKTQRTACAVPLQFAIANTIPDGLRRAASIPFNTCGRAQRNPEQQRIADCLSTLDARIAAEADKLGALKTHKKGLMQQLFPSPEGG